MAWIDVQVVSEVLRIMSSLSPEAQQQLLDALRTAAADLSGHERHVAPDRLIAAVARAKFDPEEIARMRAAVQEVFSQVDDFPDVRFDDQP
jgi:hypothetical protein